MNKETTTHLHPEIGDIFVDSFGEARVIAIADGYAMLRRKRGWPFLEICNDLMTSPHWQLHCESCKVPWQNTPASPAEPES